MVSTKMTQFKKDLEKQIQITEQTRLRALKKIDKLKRQLTDYQSDLIEATITKERLQTQLEEYNLVTARSEYSQYQMDIDRFRSKFPHLVELARQRDLEGTEDD